MAWKSKQVYVAKHDFTATREDEVSLRAGDVVEVVDDSGDWWSGSVSATSGIFPACFVHQLKSTGCCTVIFPFTPRQEDEVELVVGEQVEIFGQVELGTWAKGRVGSKVGWFPLNYVKQDANGDEMSLLETATPVQLRRTTNSKARAAVRSVGPMSAALFDPEDEPVGPLFGSLSNKMAEVATGSVEEGGKGGFLSKLRHSLGGKTSSKRRSMGGRQRLSSGSYLETQSVCSPAVARRNSISGFFGKMFSSSSRSSSKFSLHSLEEEQMKPNRLSRSWDPVCKMMPKKKTKDAQEMKIETDFRDMSLSPEASASVHKGSDATPSWVWQEEEWNTVKAGDILGSGGKRESGLKLARSDSGFGGSESTNQAVEEPFGTMEDLTDAVFEDMFSPGTSKISSKHALPAKSLTRNETATNPFLRWRRGDASTETDKKTEPITEL